MCRCVQYVCIVFEVAFFRYHQKEFLFYLFSLFSKSNEWEKSKSFRHFCHWKALLVLNKISFRDKTCVLLIKEITLIQTPTFSAFTRRRTMVNRKKSVRRIKRKSESPQIVVKKDSRRCNYAFEVNVKLRKHFTQA